ncbi:MAG: M20/M25/M40 family metallo-hydrolase, partial [Clostridia bacterium]|nr:M20/M25/M40 family metallo-hydrolase [Clostridia bacterium]
MFHLSDYLSDLETVVNIDSNSADPAGLLRVADAYARVAERFGLSVRRVRLPEQGADLLVITNHGERPRYDVLLMGHMDTVRPTGSALETPFSVEGDVAHGPGICDMKAGTLAALYVYDALPQAAKDALDIIMLFNPDEEISSRWSAPVTSDVAARTDYAVVMEATHESGRYTVSRKGSATYRVTFAGIPGHGGYIHEIKTANAVLEMARWGLELHRQNDPAALLSVNVASMHGGGAVNVVPDEAELKLNIRVATPGQ